MALITSTTLPTSNLQIFKRCFYAMSRNPIFCVRNQSPRRESSSSKRKQRLQVPKISCKPNIPQICSDFEEAQDQSKPLQPSMKPKLSSHIQKLVEEIKDELFRTSPPVDNPNAYMSASSYDTAWVAMVPDSRCPDRPMFPGCLEWVFHNQRESGGFWGEQEPGTDDVPTMECLTATLACMAALKKWNIGYFQIAQGLEFIHASSEELLMKYRGNVPRWFAIVFPGMLEIAAALGLNIFPEGLPEVVKNVFNERQKILKMEQISESGLYPPMVSYIEVLPDTWFWGPEDILRHRSDDGSLSQSPSTTAFAFMKTGDEGCMAYLESTVGHNKRHALPVPASYPVDEVLMKMCLVDKLERLGCAEFFNEEINETMELIYSDWTSRNEQKWRPLDRQNMTLQLYRDSLAFHLLRMNGYNVSAERFCWFVHDEDMLLKMEEDPSYFLSAMYNVYRASNLIFSGESELEKARIFAKELLYKAIPEGTNWNDGVLVSESLQKQIENELSNPWVTRMDYLEQRKFIESSKVHDLWIGKASMHRLPCLADTSLVELAKKNFTLQQSDFREELQELKGWAKEWSLSNIGFGREKTEYLYYTFVTNLCSPLLSEARKMMTKCAVIVTVADDFFDEEGTMDELNTLVDAIRRWVGGDLSGSGKVIFDALDDTVEDVARKCYAQTGRNVIEILRNIWRQTFESWLKEAEWSRNVHAPTMDDYLEVGTISIAIQAMVLPACFLQCPEQVQNVADLQYDAITTLVMVMSRLLNDTQSYQKEKEVGKLNLVLLNLKEKQLSDIDESIASIKDTIRLKNKEVLELMLKDGLSPMPASWKKLHLGTLKAFQMLFQSSNIFDSSTALLQNIGMAFYEPLSEDVIENQFKMMPPRSMHMK